MASGDPPDEDRRPWTGASSRTFERQTHPDVALLHQAIQSADDRIVELRAADALFDAPEHAYTRELLNLVPRPERHGRNGG